MEWERQEHEPALWFSRFEVYRLLGPRRSLESAFRQSCAVVGRPGHTWYAAAKKWTWQQRAEAYDEHMRQESRRLSARRRFDSHLSRIEMIAYLLDAVFSALAIADLGNVGRIQARELLPLLRLLFRDLLEAQRRELGVESVPGSDTVVTFRSDDLVAAAKLLKEWEQGHGPVLREPNGPVLREPNGSQAAG